MGDASLDPRWRASESNAVRSQGQEQDSPIKDPTKPAVDESSPLTDVSLMEPEYPEPLIKPGSTKRPRKSVHCKRFARAAGFASRS